MVEDINDLRLVCGDPALPGDLTEIPEPRPFGLSIQAQRIQGGGYQGSVWCDEYQIHFAPVRDVHAAAVQDANKACDQITAAITDGLVEDAAPTARPAKLD